MSMYDLWIKAPGGVWSDPSFANWQDTTTRLMCYDPDRCPGYRFEVGRSSHPLMGVLGSYNVCMAWLLGERLCGTAGPGGL